MTQQSGPVGPREDEQLAHETEGLVQGGHSTRAEEWRDPEPLDEDDPVGERAILPEDRRGTPPGMTTSDVDIRSDIARFLDRGAFPGDREQLIESAQDHQAPDGVLGHLRRLPGDEQFENVQAVAHALGLGTEERRT